MPSAEKALLKKAGVAEFLQMLDEQNAKTRDMYHSVMGAVGDSSPRCRPPLYAHMSLST